MRGRDALILIAAASTVTAAVLACSPFDSSGGSDPPAAVDGGGGGGPTPGPGPGADAAIAPGADGAPRPDAAPDAGVPTCFDFRKGLEGFASIGTVSVKNAPDGALIVINGGATAESALQRSFPVGHEFTVSILDLDIRVQLEAAGAFPGYVDVLAQFYGDPPDFQKTPVTSMVARTDRITVSCFFGSTGKSEDCGALTAQQFPSIASASIGRLHIETTWGSPGAIKVVGGTDMTTLVGRTSTVGARDTYTLKLGGNTGEGSTPKTTLHVQSGCVSFQ